MAIELRRKFQGLVTDVAETAAPETALLIADNVSLRKVGALEGRPAFVGVEPMTYSYVQSVPYRGQRVFTVADGKCYLRLSPGVQQLCWLDSAIAPYLAFTPLRVDTLRMKEARSNLYLPTAQGVNKLTSPTSSRLLIAGNPITFEVNAYVELRTHVDPILQPNQRVAYRVVSVSKDENGVIVRSRPSGWSICNNALTQPANPTVHIDAAFVALPFTEVEVYRTRIFPNTVTPDDEMQLVRAVPISAFSPIVGGGYRYIFDDNVDDDQRGVTLYTSPSRGGMENAADRPPGCATLERFRGHLFYANLTGPARRVYSFNEITRPQFTGTTTNGSAVITAVSPATTGHLVIGQHISIVAGFVGALPSGYPSVTAFTANTITVNVAATASTTATPFVALDRIGYKVGAQEGWFYPTDPTFPVEAALYYYGVSPARPGYSYTFVIESLPRGGPPIQLRATNGATYNPPINEWAVGYDAGEPAERVVNGLLWSEPDEPEHCPAKNFARVADSGRAIVALAATRDALYILKEDGVYRLTGTSAAYFRIDPVDPVTLCILPTSVQVIADSLVFLSNRGLVMVNGTQISVVSQAIQSELSLIVDQIRNNQLTTGTYLMPGFSGQTACRDEAREEYHLALGTTTPSFGGHMLVWFMRAQGFTTYTLTATPVCLSDGAGGQPVVLSATSYIEARSGLPTALSIRIMPHGFISPETTQKHWTHITAALQNTEYLTSLTARVSSSGPYTPGVYTDEPFELKGNFYPVGALLRTLVPRAHQRAWMVHVELRADIANGVFQLEHIGMESIAAVPNRNDMRSAGSS